jgi:hypothetical protein
MSKGGPHRRLTLTQKVILLRLLLGAKGRWIPLPEILSLGLAQYSARIFELRRDGYVIENRTEHDAASGAIHSWFRLVAEPEKATPKNVAAPEMEKAETGGFKRAHEADEKREDDRFPLFAGAYRR